jgi:hypothetical protein
METSGDVQLTDEQKQRIALNRKNALKRKLEVAEEEKIAEETLANDSMSCQVTDSSTGQLCGGQPVSKDLLLTFGESCCERCRYLNDDYTLINKSDVVSQFLLPQDSIKMMKFSTKMNPRNSMFAPMKLYLRKHAMQKSFKRWGGADGLMQELDRREKSRFDRGLAECEGALENGSDDDGISAPDLISSSRNGIVGEKGGPQTNDGTQKKGRKAKVNSVTQKRSAQLSKMVLAIRDTKETHR